MFGERSWFGLKKCAFVEVRKNVVVLGLITSLLKARGPLSLCDPAPITLAGEIFILLWKSEKCRW